MKTFTTISRKNMMTKSRMLNKWKRTNRPKGSKLLSNSSKGSKLSKLSTRKQERSKSKNSDKTKRNSFFI